MGKSKRIKDFMQIQISNATYKSATIIPAFSDVSFPALFQ
jgi:hypothetical protein